MIAGIFGSHGYATIFPNYVGYSNPYVPHPYVLYPQQNVQSALEALELGHLLIESYYGRPIQFIRVSSVGYSEGGAYSIWLSKCLTNKT